MKLTTNKSMVQTLVVLASLYIVVCSSTLLGMCSLAIVGTPTTTPSCNNSPTGTGNGTITVFFSGGTSPFTYQVDGTGPVVPVPSNASPFVIPNVVTGIHTVTITDASTPVCTATSPVVTVGTAVSPSVTISGARNVCLGVPLVLTASVTSGGTLPFVYTWTGPNGFFQAGPNPTIKIPSVSSVNTGSYSVQVVDANYCSNTVAATVTVTPCAVLTLTKTANKNSLTQDGCISFSLLVANNGTGQAQNVVLTDVLPACLSFVKSVTNDGWVITNVDQTVTATLPVLQAGQTAALSVTAQGNGCTGSTVTNTAQVTSTGTSAVTANLEICLKK